MTEQHPIAPAYPARLEIDYPEEGLSRVTTAFRLVLLIPVAVISALLTSSAADWADDVDPWMEITAFTLSTSGFVVVPLLLAILFRGKYPRWWFDWNLELCRFLARVTAYAALLRDEYPSLDEAQAVRLEIDYPDAGSDLNRWLPLVKWFLAIPHYIVLTLLGVAAVVPRRACMVHDPLLGTLSAGDLRLSGRSLPVGPAGERVHVPPRHGSLSAVQPRSLTGMPTDRSVPSATASTPAAGKVTAVFARPDAGWGKRSVH